MIGQSVLLAAAVFAAASPPRDPCAAPGCRNAGSLASSTDHDNVTSVQFLHVGKAAGTTVQFVLTHLKKPGGGRCLDLTVVHMRQPTTYGSRIVMSTRDPLERVVSAFNYRHPSRGYPKIRNRPLPGFGAQEEIELYRCFDRVNDFAKALSGTGRCADLARSVFRCCPPEVQMPRTMMFGQGYRYYLGPLGIDAFERQSYTLTHVRTLAADLRRIAHWLGCAPPPASLPRNRSEYASENDTRLSPVGRRNLMRALAGEYALLARLKAHDAFGK